MNVEVAAEERGHGLGRELFEAVSAETAGTALEGLDLRARVEAGSVGEKFAEALGFVPLTTTRVIKVPAGALPPSGGGRAEDLEIVSTGSVKLTKAFAQWYAAVNRDDAVAPLTIGQVATAFPPRPPVPTVRPCSRAIPRRPVPARCGERAECLRRLLCPRSRACTGRRCPGCLGEPARERRGGAGDGTHPRLDVRDPRGRRRRITRAVRGGGRRRRVAAARLSVDADVVIEGTSGMPVVSALADRLLAAGQASELYRYETLTGPPADTH